VVVAALVLLSAGGACGWWLAVANGVICVGSLDDNVYSAWCSGPTGPTRWACIPISGSRPAR